MAQCAPHPVAFFRRDLVDAALQRVLKSIAQVAVAGAAIGSAVLLLIVCFSSYETRHACHGTFFSEQTEKTGAMSLHWEHYRVGVMLWSPSKGTLSTETADGRLGFFPELHGTKQISIADASGRLVGTYSELSKKLKIASPDTGNFVGTCERVAGP